MNPTGRDGPPLRALGLRFTGHCWPCSKKQDTLRISIAQLFYIVKGSRTLTKGLFTPRSCAMIWIATMHLLPLLHTIAHSSYPAFRLPSQHHRITVSMSGVSASTALG
jgi:hypothetical protein